MVLGFLVDSSQPMIGIRNFRTVRPTHDFHQIDGSLEMLDTLCRLTRVEQHMGQRCVSRHGLLTVKPIQLHGQRQCSFRIGSSHGGLVGIEQDCRH